MKISGVFMAEKISISCASEKQAKDLLLLLNLYFCPDDETLAFMEKKEGKRR